MMKLIVWGLAIFGGVTLVQKVRERLRLDEDRSPEFFEEAVIIAVEPDLDLGGAEQEGAEQGAPAGEARQP